MADWKKRGWRYEWMGRWVDGKMIGWEDERMGRWADGRMSEWEDERMGRWVDGKMSGWKYERMEKWADARMSGLKYERMGRWVDARISEWKDERMRRGWRPNLNCSLACLEAEDQVRLAHTGLLRQLELGQVVEVGVEVGVEITGVCRPWLLRAEVWWQSLFPVHCYSSPQELQRRAPCNVGCIR